MWPKLRTRSGPVDYNVFMQLLLASVRNHGYNFDVCRPRAFSPVPCSRTIQQLQQVRGSTATDLESLFSETPTTDGSPFRGKHLREFLFKRPIATCAQDAASEQ